MISIVVRDLPYLKLLHPICLELQRLQVPYIIYHMDIDRGEKNYNRASLTNMNKSSPQVVSGAKKVKAFFSDEHLLKQLAHDRITKLVSVEIWLWAKKYIHKLKNLNIKTYSVLYLTDGIFEPAKSLDAIDKVYYSSKYAMEMYHEFSGAEYNPNRDRYLGSPLFDSISQHKNGDGILVLLPNIRADHVKSCFRDKENFIKIMEKLASAGKLIYKTRKKQWLPKEILLYASKIVDDGGMMYPPVSSTLFKESYTTCMFNSSGIYEAVYAGNYVVNITLPLNRWPHLSQDKLERYFSIKPDTLYQFDGIVKSITQTEALGNWKFQPYRADEEQRDKWVKKYIGNTENSAMRITKDIISK